MFLFGCSETSPPENNDEEKEGIGEDEDEDELPNDEDDNEDEPLDPRTVESCDSCNADEICVGRWSVSPYDWVSTNDANGGAGGDDGVLGGAGGGAGMLELDVSVSCYPRPTACSDEEPCVCSDVGELCGPPGGEVHCEDELPPPPREQQEVDVSHIEKAIFCAEE